MRYRACRWLVLGLLSAVGCSSPQAPSRGDDVAKGAPGKAEGAAATARAASSDACDLPPLGTSMFACLLPSSDSRHDPSKRVAPDVDCYWQVKAPIDKDLHTDATGAMLVYSFHVENKCAETDVDVDLQSPPGTLSNWYCPVEQLPIPRASSNNFSCYTSYATGDVTRERSYTLRVVRVNGQIAAPVELDPEVVLEKSGAEGIIPEFKARRAP